MLFWLFDIYVWLQSVDVWWLVFMVACMPASQSAGQPAFRHSASQPANLLISQPTIQQAGQTASQPPANKPASEQPTR